MQSVDSAATWLCDAARPNLTEEVASLLRDENGQDLIEYGLMATLLALACMMMVHGLGTQIATLYSGLTTGFSAAT